MPYRRAPMEHVIDRALGEYLARAPDAAFPELDVAERQVARRWRAVPLYRSTFDTIFLTASGSFVAWQCDPPAPPERVRLLDTNGLDVTFLTAAGARVHPALAALLPRRPPHALECHSCAGAGHRADTGICHVCKGLGWRR